MKQSAFVEGVIEALSIANELEGTGESELSERLQIALSSMMNGYYERLVRMSNRIESEMSVLEHAKEHMRRVVFPGDLRAEGKEPE